MEPDTVQYAEAQAQRASSIAPYASLRHHPAMPNYRRVFIPGGTWFFTVNLLERRQRLLTENVTTLRHAIFWTKRCLPFRIDALVILPDHLHAVLTLPPGDANYPQRLRHIKSRFSKSLPKSEWLSGVRKKRGERGIWQRRYWEHYIRDVSWSRLSEQIIRFDKWNLCRG